MLQGSLDNFALDEVLGLLSGTAKTGRLRVSGDRGSGSLWLTEGQLVDSHAASLGEATIEDVVFELMRYKSGNFSFTVDETSDGAAQPQIVDLVVAAAAERMDEWKEIEAVVPSMDHVLSPVAELSVDEVTISCEQWRLLVTIGERAAVREVCAELGLSEVDGSRLLKNLLELELIEITEDPRSRNDVATLEELLQDEPEAEAPVFEAPAFEAPVFEAPVAEAPTFEAPVYEAPAYVASVPETPVFESAPAFQPDALDTSMFVELLGTPDVGASSPSDEADTPAFTENVDSSAAADDADGPSFGLAIVEAVAVEAAGPAAPRPSDLIEEAPTPFATFAPEAPSFDAPSFDAVSPFESTLDANPFSADVSETADQIGITDQLPVPPPAPRSERPPMPAPPALADFAAPVGPPSSGLDTPPSPAEIESFRESISDPSELDESTAESNEASSGGFIDDGSPEEQGSLLMRYLKSER